MTLDEKLELLHEIATDLPNTKDRETRESVLKEAAQALLYVYSKDVEQQFLQAMKDFKKPLSSIQKLLVEMCQSSCRQNPDNDIPTERNNP